MKAVIEPSTLSGIAKAPPSKSMAHRLLIAASLADSSGPKTGSSGPDAGSDTISTVRNLALSEDILATCDCLRALGAEIELMPDSLVGSRDTAVSEVLTARIRGISTDTTTSNAGPGVLHCRESGSTLRFMIPVCAALGGEYILTGSERLLSRPLTVYEDIFSNQGIEFNNDGTAVRIDTGTGKLRSGEYTVDGSISSQFITGLLFALPLLEGNSTLHITPPVESRPYIDMTLEALGTFGVNAVWTDYCTLAIPGGQRYSPREVTVEGDWSNAAFLIALGDYADRDSGLEVTGLREDSLQGDKVIRPLLEQLRKGPAEIDISDCPDLGPVLMAYAALHHGAVLTGTRRLSIKESDRGEAMKEELARFGVTLTTGPDRIEVPGTCTEDAALPLCTPDEELNGHNDHRIVMALSLLCLKTGGTIDGAEAVRKSYPDYFARISELGAVATCID